jgi:hypothetical protein
MGALKGEVFPLPVVKTGEYRSRSYLKTELPVPLTLYLYT